MIFLLVLKFPNYDRTIANLPDPDNEIINLRVPKSSRVHHSAPSAPITIIHCNSLPYRDNNMRHPNFIQLFGFLTASFGFLPIRPFQSTSLLPAAFNTTMESPPAVPLTRGGGEIYNN